MNSLASTKGPSVTSGRLLLPRTTFDRLGSASACVAMNSPFSFVDVMKAMWPFSISCCCSSVSCSRTVGSTCIMIRYFTLSSSWVVRRCRRATRWSSPTARIRHHGGDVLQEPANRGRHALVGDEAEVLGDSRHQGNVIAGQPGHLMRGDLLP